MPNWKKVIVSGSDANLRNITASGDISASGELYAGLSPWSSGTPAGSNQVVVWNDASGELMYTGSYSSGDEGTIIIKENGTTIVAAATTIDFLNSIVTDGGSGEANVGFDLQGVTDSGAITTSGSLFFHNQSLAYPYASAQNAKSGFRVDSGKAYTHVTPQSTGNTINLLGIHHTPSGVGPYPDNFITMNKGLVFLGEDGPYGGGGGGTDPDTDHPSDDGGLMVVTGKGIQIQASSSASSIEKDNKARGIYMTPSAFYFINTDASASISGGLQPQSASAQIRFNTASNAVQFLAGSTNETLKEVLFISRSGDNPRIGIGTTNPLRAFDFKEIRDDNRGGEILIRGSRTTRGAEAADEAGRINFAIDSSSYNNIETSGSTAEIVALVDQIDTSGVRGSLSLRVSSVKGDAPIEKLRITPTQIQATGSFVISGSNSFTNIGPATFSGSVAITDTLGVDGITTHNNNVVISNGLLDANDSGVKIRGTAGLTIGDNIIPGAGQLRVNDFSMLLGGVHVGGTSDPGTDNLLVDGTTTLNDLIVNGTASISYFETLYETSSIIYSSGSTKFGDTMDDFHDFTGSVDITGSIVASNLSGTNTGDQDLSSYSTIVQLNASSSALQTNIDAKASITQLNASSSALQTNIDAKVSNSSTASFAITGSNVTFANITSSGDIRTDKLILTDAGSASDMAIHYSTDSNTGIYFPASDNISLQAGGGNVELNLNPNGINSTGNFNLTGNIIASGDISASGAITGSDVYIDDWGSVSSSLATLDSTTLQDVTDNGSTTTNNITIDSTGDARLVLDRAANANDSEIEFKTNGTTNWSIGTGQIGSDADFTFKGQDGSNYIRINQSGQADFLSAVTSSDVHIDDWGSVSASLATIPTNNNQLTNGAGYTTNTGTVDTTGTPANNQLAIFTDSDTIEGDSDLTWDGSTFTINGTGSVDLLQVDNKLQGNGSGFQFFAFNEDTVKVKFANWYSSNDRQYGMGQLWYETWFAAIDNQAGRDNRRIGFYLEEPDAGSTDSGTPGQHPTNARFYVDITGSYIASGGLYVTDADFEVSSTGHVTASGAISASGTIVGSNLSGTNTGDQDLSSYSTIVQLNASSSALQSNIDAKASITQLNASSSALQSNIDGKQATLTFGKLSGNALKSEEALTTNDVLLMGSSNVKGRTYAELKTDLSLNNVENTALSTYTGNGGSLDNQYITNGAGYTTNTGTATSVGGTGTVSGLSLSGTVTTSGNLTLGGTISISSTNITDVDAFSQSGTYASLRAQGTTAGDVGLGNVTNESKATMFTSPTFTGTVAIPGFADVSASLASATAGGGTITGVTAGDGLTGGGSAGTVTLNVVGGTGITANANDIAVDATIATVVQLNASSSALQTNIDGKQATLTFGKSSGNALKSEEALTTNDVLLMGSSNVKGRTYSQFRSDINVEDGADVTDTANVQSSLLNQSLDLGSGEIETNTVSTVTTVIGSDAATNVDTFATSTYNGAIYDYILKDSTVGARAGQFMVAHDDGDVTFTDTSTKHLSDSTIPEITADISGGSTVRVRVTNGNGYTFKSFVKKL